jgi:hypothetical protein
MKIITRAVLDWDGNVLEEESFECSGPIAACKSAGNAPQPVNPYEQAGAQYGLATGTADYNAALERTGVSNPLGSSSWDVTGYSGAPTESPGTIPASAYFGLGGSGAPAGAGTFNLTQGGYTYPSPTGAGGGIALPEGAYSPYESAGEGYGIPNGSGAPLYTQTTSLAPWAQSLEESPINTSQIPGMPGGPSLQSNVNNAEQATYGQEMELLAPQEQQQQEQTQSQLEAEGAMPGSAAYGYGENMMNLEQGAENTQAANQAVTTGMGELPMFYGLGSTDLQNQLALRNAPISEFEALQGNGGGNVSAATPDISGAFTQQEQAALAAYNAQVASGNATTGALGGLASAGLMGYLMSAAAAA